MIAGKVKDFNYSYDTLYCFGAGSIGKDFCDYLYEKGCDLNNIVFVDNNERLHDTYKIIEEIHIPIISKEKMISCIKGTDQIVIATLACAEIFEDLQKEDVLITYTVFFAQVILSSQIKIGEIPINSLDVVNKIPKIIHYFWLGGNEMPQEMKKYIDDWKRMCPDYEIIKWDESNYDFSKNKYMKQAYEHKKWGFVSDYARLDVLYEYGGIYLDTDVELKQSLDILLKYDAFFAITANLKVNTGNGFGAVKNHPLIGKMRDVYETVDFVTNDGMLNEVPCMEYQYRPLRVYGFELNGECQENNNVGIVPFNVMCAYNHYVDEYTVDENTIAIHHGKRSWHDKKRAEWAKNSLEMFKRMNNNTEETLQ